MNELSTSDHETFSYSMIDKIDQLCDQYERELRSGSQPKIEDYLEKANASARTRLLRDLVAVDVEFVRRDGDVDFAEYFKRFPEADDILRDLQKELEASKQTRDSTPPVPIGQDNTLVATPEPRPHLSHFKLLEVAGTGGFGTVWRAMDLRLQREVAVKIPRADKANRIDMSGLMREARAAAKLRHPNIVSVHEVGVENGTSFIVTDYIHGMNLRDWRRKNPINPHEAASLIAKLAKAVQHAHEKGVIHRDLKLGNVLIDAQGEPHVADFGLAKSEARDDSLAVNGQVLGTPAYMAPEQARADHNAIDRRTDVYAIGVMLYELLTGRTPFRGDVEELLQQILDQPPVSPRLIKPGIPKDLEAICLKCLAKDSDRRYDTAQAVADDLNLFLNGETLRGIPAAIPNRVWKWFRRNRRSVVITVTVALFVALGSTGAMALRYRGILPSVPMRDVEFQTEPPGCEITVTAVDPETGEPDPTKIQTARGRTPLTMSLASGDYLVTAVLDSQRFNEVFRHVPDDKEKIPYKYRHLSWRMKKGTPGIIESPKIPIPRPDVSVEMAFCEGTDGLIEPASSNQPTARTWKLPAFYVDRREVSLDDLKQNDFPEVFAQKTDDGPSAFLNFYSCLSFLEKVGKRLPSAAELYYLSTTVCPNPAPDFDDKSPCLLADKSLIEGLHSGVWEWTSTKPGGAFSGAVPVPKSLGFDALLRVIRSGGGAPPGQGMTKTGFVVTTEFGGKVAGCRGVRSTKPRRTPQDFAVPLTR